jgi:hypothetical protein
VTKTAVGMYEIDWFQPGGHCCWAGSRTAAPGPGRLIPHPLGGSNWELWGTIEKTGGIDGLSARVLWENGRRTWERKANLHGPVAIA